MPIKITKPADVPGSAAPAIMVGLFVAFGGVLFGYDTGTIGGILGMQHWRDLFSTGEYTLSIHSDPILLTLYFQAIRTRKITCRISHQSNNH